MACSKTSGRIMIRKTSLFFLLFIFFTLNISPLLAVGIELFSLTYNGNGDLKIDILYNSAYDEEKIKKELLQIKRNEQRTRQLEQKIKELLAKDIPLQKAKTQKNIDEKRRLAEEIVSQMQIQNMRK
jgi:hypothetical protein